MGAEGAGAAELPCRGTLPILNLSFAGVEGGLPLVELAFPGRQVLLLDP